MVQAVKSNPAYLGHASDELIGDSDLLLAATCERIALLDAASLDRWFDNQGIIYPPDLWLETFEHVREKLRVHETFVKLILCAMQSSEERSATPFALLSQGEDTSLVHAKLIAEYVGVPTGEELRMLRNARANLAMIGLN